MKCVLLYFDRKKEKKQEIFLKERKKERKKTEQLVTYAHKKQILKKRINFFFNISVSLC